MLLSLDNPIVRQIQEDFETHNHGPKRKVDFEKVYNAFNDPSTDFPTISSNLKYSLHHVRYLFHEVIKPIVPRELHQEFYLRLSAKGKEHRNQVARRSQSDENTAAAILYQEAVRKKIACKRILTKDGYMRRYVKFPTGLCYTLVARNSRKFSTDTVCKHFVFSLGKRPIQKVKFIIFIAEGKDRIDFYLFHKSELDNFTAKYKRFYIRDVTTPPMYKPRSTHNTIFLEDHRNRWNIPKSELVD